MRGGMRLRLRVGSAIENRRSSRGGVLLIVLVVILVGGALSAGWVAVMSAETAYVETMTDASQRRVAELNATALARQYFATRLLTKNVANAPAVTADVGGGWGVMSTAAIGSALVPLESTVGPNGWNHFNPADGAGFSVTRSVALAAVAGDPFPTVRNVLLRSYSPELAGTLLTRNKPTLNAAPTTLVSGSVGVLGEAVVWFAGAGSISATTFNAPSSLPPDVLVANFPFVARTSGDVGTSADFAGRLNVIKNGGGPNELFAKLKSPVLVDGTSGTSGVGWSSDGAGTVTLDLSNPNLEAVFIEGNTSRIVFTGQTTVAEGDAADLHIALLVVFVQPLGSPDLVNVDFTGFSERKLVFAVKKLDGTGVNFNFLSGAAAEWRGIFTLENCPLTLNISSPALGIRGGLRSDRDVTVPTGTLTFAREPEPRLLDQLTARDGWLEVFSP